MKSSHSESSRSESSRTNVCRRCLVSGRVQGVFFRDSTRERALELGVAGRAVNLSDGRVEVYAAGPADAVEALCRWLRDGPSSARVEEVRCETVDAADAPQLEGFEIR